MTETNIISSFSNGCVIRGGYPAGYARLSCLVSGVGGYYGRNQQNSRPAFSEPANKIIIQFLL
ncbi:MAG: hypothetical protein J5824_05825 [Lachnospiraceae bacterium]|nr:hypothetical protein [Lachnospiraceae bacterium]